MKIKHVYGNVLRIDIPLTIKIRTIEEGAPSEREEPFYPDATKGCIVELANNYNRKIGYNATIKDNIVHIEDIGKISIGQYKVTVKCYDASGNPYRYMVRDIVEICDATADAGIEAGVEFNAETYTLEGAVFVSYGVEQVQSDWEEDDETSKAFIKNKPDIYTKTETDAHITQQMQAERERAEYAEQALGQAIGTKQDTINDLQEIRQGAQLGATAIQEEQDPTVPQWAKAANKPSYNANEVGALPSTTKYGSTIDMVLNSTTYVLTLTLKDQDGNSLNSKSVDLPLESVVVNGRYDAASKKIILTLQSGSTLDIPVGDLVAGLQSEITSTNMLDADLVDDTNSAHKFVSAQEKEAWNNKSDFSGSYNDLTDKPTIPAAQIQSDWNQTDSSAKDFIKNKPAIPAAQVNADWNADSGVAQILNKPAIPDTSDCIKKSSTAGLVKNDGTIDTNTYLTQNDISGKANKSEMSVTDGTGADSDKTTIQLKNGTSATVLKSHQSLSGKQDVIDAQHKLSADLVDDTNSTNKFTNATEKQTWNSKQDAINDLAAIRSGASAGATAVQPETLNSALSDTIAESGVYDVTSNNDNAKFASLSALLNSENLDTLIPLTKRRGGMSIKFVQSSDNKYVQYRYMGTATTGSPNPFLDTANWQGVDDEPTAGSDNLVKSGGVYNTPTVTNSIAEHDLDISDEHGNVLVRYAGGHLQVKNFSSADVLDSIQAILSNVGFNNVPEFDEETDYAVGDIVRYGKYVYVFTSEHTAGEWDNTEVERTVINTEHPVEVANSSTGSDLDVSDESGNVLARFENGHIKTKNFDSSNIVLDRYAKKKTIKYLAIGNSVNQDPACYIPYLLRKLYGDNIDFEIGVAYHGSYTIKDYVELMITGQENLETFSYAKNTERLTNITNVPLSYVVDYADWDIVSFEAYQTDMAGSGRTEDVTLAPDLLDWLKQHTKDGCRFGLITPATYTDVRNLYVGWQQDILTSCSLDFLLDYGATKEFLIAKGFVNSDLSPIEGGRYIHSREGFPCEALALTAIHFLADIVKIDDKASNILAQITEIEHNALNVPQQNGAYTSTTEEGWRKCVDAALNGWRVSLASYAISNNTLRDNTFTNI